MPVARLSEDMRWLVVFKRVYQGARAELRSWRSSVDEVVVGEMDSAPSPASGSSLDVVVNELPMDFNSCFICTNGEPVSPHTRRPYCGHGARTVGGGVTR